MIETLFGYSAGDKNKKEPKKESSSQDQFPRLIQIIEPKKAQNLAILLKALNVTIEEVCDALLEGNFFPFVNLTSKSHGILQIYTCLEIRRNRLTVTSILFLGSFHYAGKIML